MNMLEHYIQPGYKLVKVKAKNAKQFGLTNDTDWVIYNGKIDVYGGIENLKRPFTIDEWNDIKQKGYFMEMC